MATRTTLDSKTPAPTLSSPRSPATTTVVATEKLQGPEQSSNATMQNFQKLQTQATAAAPPLANRVTTKVVDDLDDLLSSTLAEMEDEEKTSLSPSSPQSTPAAVPKQVHPDSSPPAFESKAAFYLLEKNLMALLVIPLQSSMPAAASKKIEEATKELGQDINRTIGFINLMFKSLLQASDSPSAWLEKESSTSFYQNYCPFATSHFLSKHLEKAKNIHPFLKAKLIAEWKENYQQCVLLLKQHKLDAYNKTEFPFSAHLQEKAMKLEQLSQNPVLFELFKQAVQPFISNPEAAMQQLHEHDPELAERLGAQMKAHDPHAMQAEEERLFQSATQPVVSFFRDLELLLQAQPQDRVAIEGWLKTQALKQDYFSPFYFWKDLMHQLKLRGGSVENYPPFVVESNNLYENCCQQLIKLGLQEFLDESPSPALIAQYRAKVSRELEEHQRGLRSTLDILRPLCIALKELPANTQALESNRHRIEDWFDVYRAKKNYTLPFMCAKELFEFQAAVKGLLDPSEMQELIEIYPFCRDQLLALGLGKYLDEIPQMESPEMERPAAAAPKKTLTDTERFEKELKFFLLMLKQTDKDLDQWLKDNSPAYDYPLLWANKRMPKRKDYSDKVSSAIRQQWTVCGDACIEKAKNTPLFRHYLERVPEDASPELLAFLKT